MATKITVFEPIRVKSLNKKRVCAYARVSTNNEDMLHSLKAQVSFYMEYITSHVDWEFVEIFYDKPTTGTKEERPEFLRMLEMCRQGKIDMILTKSISRFARNTVTTLKYTRELKALGVDVYFENENLHTISSDGELLLSLYASYAQEQSLNTSKNCNWRIKKGFENGIMTNFKILGYDWIDHQLYINEKEAEIVKKIYSKYLKGKGFLQIVKDLKADGIKTKFGNDFCQSAIRKILTNEKYIGDICLQKTYVQDHLTKKKVQNTGQRDKIYVTENHEPIIDRETFQAVQDLLAQKQTKYKPKVPTVKSVFSSKIQCGTCGKNYKRKIVRKNQPYEKVVWMCGTFDTLGKSACSSKQIPEDILIESSRIALKINEFDEKLFNKEIQSIEAFNGNRLIFYFKDGSAKEILWQDKSRADSWTDDMRIAASKKSKANLERSQ